MKWFYSVTEPDLVDYDIVASFSEFYENSEGIVSDNPAFGYLAYGLF